MPLNSGKCITREDSTSPGKSTESTNTKVCLTTMRQCSTTHCTFAMRKSSKQAILKPFYSKNMIRHALAYLLLYIRRLDIS